MFLRKGDPDKAFNYVKKVISDIKNKKIPNSKMIISTQLQRSPDKYTSIGPHVAVATRMSEKGITVGPGSLIKYVVTAGDGRIRDKAKLPEEAKEGSYDTEYYIKNQVVPVVGRIFDVFGFSEEKLLGESVQKKLF